MRAAAPLLVTGAGLLLCACGSDADVVSIYGYSVSGGVTITAELNWCGAASVTARENEESVTLTARPGERNEGDCASSVTVTLTEPLGNRDVVDAATGDTIPRLR